MSRGISNNPKRIQLICRRCLIEVRIVITTISYKRGMCRRCKSIERRWKPWCSRSSRIRWQRNTRILPKVRWWSCVTKRCWWCCSVTKGSQSIYLLLWSFWSEGRSQRTNAFGLGSVVRVVIEPAYPTIQRFIIIDLEQKVQALVGADTKGIVIWVSSRCGFTMSIVVYICILTRFLYIQWIRWIQYKVKTLTSVRTKYFLKGTKIIRFNIQIERKSSFAIFLTGSIPSWAWVVKSYMFFATSLSWMFWSIELLEWIDMWSCSSESTWYKLSDVLFWKTCFQISANFGTNRKTKVKVVPNKSEQINRLNEMV